MKQSVHNLLREFVREMCNVKDRQFDAEGNHVFDKPNQMLAACVLIVSKDGKILAVSRRDDPTMWGLPGGKVDPGETPAEAAERELFEETGLKVTGLKHVFTRPGDEGGYTTYTFTGQASGMINTNEEGLIRWVTPQVLMSPETSPFASYNQLLFAKIRLVDDPHAACCAVTSTSA